MLRYIAIIILIGVLASCTATRTVQVPVETERTVMRTDTLRELVYTRDTVIDRDTVLMQLRGDTIYKEVIRWRLRVREKADTLLQTRTDSVYIESPVTVTVSAPLTRWQSIKQNLGGYAISLSAALLLAPVLWLRFRKK